MDKRIPGLDGLRAISILLVIVGHAFHSVPKDHSLSSWLITVLGNGSLGVSSFFVISGFLITTILLQGIKANHFTFRDFFLRRAFRIWPAFYTYIACVSILGYLGFFSITKMEVLSASLFIWNYSLGASTPVLGHTWSLAVEEQYYLIWPVVLVFLKPRRATWLAITIIGISPLIRVATYVWFPHLRDHTSIMLHTRADTLMVGSLAALFAGNLNFQKILTRLFRIQMPLLAFLFLLIVDPTIQSYYRGSYALTIGWTLQNISIVIVMLWVIDSRKGLARTLLNSPIMTHIGVISYSLYLWQQLFLMGPNNHIALTLKLLFSFLCAESSYWLIEQPFLGLRRRLLRRKGHSAIVAALAT